MRQTIIFAVHIGAQQVIPTKATEARIHRRVRSYHGFEGAINPGVPPYVLLSEEQTRNPEIATVMRSAYLGSQHAPFTILQDSFQHDFQQEKIIRATSNLTLADDFTLARVADRRSLLLNLDRFSRQAEMVRALDGNGSFMQTELDMLTSGTARRAFNLNEESTATRDRYGRHRWGQMGLLARRLVESGVTFVTLNTAPDSLCWDWHRNIVNDHRPVDGTDGPSRGMDISGPLGLVDEYFNCRRWTPSWPSDRYFQCQR